MEGCTQQQTSQGYRSRHAFEWGEESFFEDAEHKRTPSEALAIRRIFNYCISIARLKYGSGYINGSFSAIFPGVSERAPITVFSNGRLRLNFGNLHDEETSNICRDALADKLREIETIRPIIPSALREQTVNLKIERWGGEVGRVIVALEHMRSKTP